MPVSDICMLDTSKAVFQTLGAVILSKAVLSHLCPAPAEKPLSAGSRSFFFVLHVDHLINWSGDAGGGGDGGGGRRRSASCDRRSCGHLESSN